MTQVEFSPEFEKTLEDCTLKYKEQLKKWAQEFSSIKEFEEFWREFMKRTYNHDERNIYQEYFEGMLEPNPEHLHMKMLKDPYSSEFQKLFDSYPPDFQESLKKWSMFFLTTKDFEECWEKARYKESED